MYELDWIYNLKNEVPKFLGQMKGQRPGFYRYSLTGDLFDESAHWGLGNTVFATKCYYTLGLLGALPPENQSALVDFIQSFETNDGLITDPLVRRKAFWREKASAVRHRDLSNFFHAQTARAETRQAISALHLLGAKPRVYPTDIPKTIEGVNRYLNALDWTKPWGAGSHFSHLLFFLTHSQIAEKDALVLSAIEWVNRIQDPESGAWFKGTPSLRQKVNGAMKIITGLKAAGRMDFTYADKLIDLALGAQNDTHACDNFNIVYVLKYANQIVEGAYRNDEIRSFALKRLAIYHEYYWPEHGGFSFFKGRANDYYYKMILTKGRAEPDIHGTTLFLWGIALIADLLEVNDRLGFKEFTP